MYAWYPPALDCVYGEDQRRGEVHRRAHAFFFGFGEHVGGVHGSCDDVDKSASLIRPFDVVRFDLFARLGNPAGMHGEAVLCLLRLGLLGAVENLIVSGDVRAVLEAQIFGDQRL